MNMLHVAVLAGGPSSEAAVSRTSAAAVKAALSQAGHRPEVLELDGALAGALRAGAYDVVFPVTHGPLGEDGCVQGLLEVLDLPYVGSDVRASAIAASKPHAKALLRQAGLPVAPDARILRGDALGGRAVQLRSELGPALVIKPASGGSAIGITRIGEHDDDAALTQAIECALAIDECALVEPLLTGQEVTCGILEDAAQPRGWALAPTLILSRAADWYDFESKYAAGGSEHRCPAGFSKSLTARIQQVALQVHQALGARDLSRVDFIVGEGESADALHVLELNSLPGMTATSLFPEAAAVAGIDFPTLCDGLIRRAHARPRRVAPDVIPMPPPVQP